MSALAQRTARTPGEGCAERGWGCRILIRSPCHCPVLGSRQGDDCPFPPCRGSEKPTPLPSFPEPRLVPADARRRKGVGAGPVPATGPGHKLGQGGAALWTTDPGQLSPQPGPQLSALPRNWHLVYPSKERGASSPGPWEVGRWEARLSLSPGPGGGRHRARPSHQQGLVTREGNGAQRRRRVCPVPPSGYWLAPSREREPALTL